MPDLLNGISRGSGVGTSPLLTMQGGRFQATLATNVPGDECDPGASFDGIPCNSALFFAGLYHSVLTDLYATAAPDGTLTPAWTTRNSDRAAGNNPERSGVHFCLTAAGPGVVHAFRNPVDGTTRVIRYDADTDSIGAVFDQTSGTEFVANHIIYSSYVVGGNLLFLFGNSNRCQVWNLETGQLTNLTMVGNASVTRMIAELGGNIYTYSRDAGTGLGAFFVFLGGDWIKVRESGDTVTAFPIVGSGWPCWARNGKLYGCARDNAGNDGWQMQEYDPSTGVIQNVSNTLLDPLLRTGGGLTDINSAERWDAGFYVDVDELGNPRYMLQVFPDLSDQNPGCVLFEHTDAGLVLVGDTNINGGANCKTLQQSNVAPYSYRDVTGKLWGAKWAKAQAADNGMLLTFRFGGDPGNADKVIRISVAAPPGAPVDRANNLVAPPGGLGQPGASLFEESPGVWRVDGWDANGVDNLTVVHRTIADSIPNGIQAEWTAKISES